MNVAFMKTWSYRFAFFLMAIVVTMTCRGQGVLIARHLGANNPVTEGFTLVQAGDPSLSPVVDDEGVNAWSIGLRDSDDIVSYSRRFTSEEVSMLSAGWVLSMTLRVVEPFAPPTYGILASIRTGNEKLPSLSFGAQSDGDPIVRIGEVEYLVEGAGPGYHRYELRQRGGREGASLWVDGTVLVTGISGRADLSADFGFGGGQRPLGSPSVQANWHEVSLTAIPEPNTVLLFSCGIAWLLLIRGKRNACRDAC